MVGGSKVPAVEVNKKLYTTQLQRCYIRFFCNYVMLTVCLADFSFVFCSETKLVSNFRQPVYSFRVSKSPTSLSPLFHLSTTGTEPLNWHISWHFLKNFPFFFFLTKSLDVSCDDALKTLFSAPSPSLPLFLILIFFSNFRYILNIARFFSFFCCSLSFSSSTFSWLQASPAESKFWKIKFEIKLPFHSNYLITTRRTGARQYKWILFSSRFPVATERCSCTGCTPIDAQDATPKFVAGDEEPSSFRVADFKFSIR